MKFVLSILLFAGAVIIPASGWSQEFGASWLRTQKSKTALNPNITAIGDFVGRTGPRRSESGLSLREAEVGLQADVDPYARADFFIGLPQGEEVELEEGYVSLTSLPYRIQARGGKFKANLFRMNMIHSHELPQVDAPLVMERFLGAEGINEAGVEASRTFAPLGIFTEVSYSVLQGLGPQEERTAEVLDTSGNPVTVKIETESERTNRVRDMAHGSRIRSYADVTDSANIEIGASGAWHQPKNLAQTRIGGVDATFRWKPLQEGLYRSFIWRTELMLLERFLSPDKVTRRGAYTYAQYQWARRWNGGVRLDYAESVPSVLTVDTKGVTRQVSPYVSFIASEFHRVRAQFQQRYSAQRRSESLGWLQWTVVLGPHGAHPF